MSLAPPACSSSLNPTYFDHKERRHCTAKVRRTFPCAADTALAFGPLLSHAEWQRQGASEWSDEQHCRIRLEDADWPLAGTPADRVPPPLVSRPCATSRILLPDLPRLPLSLSFSFDAPTPLTLTQSLWNASGEHATDYTSLLFPPLPFQPLSDGWSADLELLVNETAVLDAATKFAHPPLFVSLRPLFLTHQYLVSQPRQTIPIENCAQALLHSSPPAGGKVKFVFLDYERGTTTEYCNRGSVAIGEEGDDERVGEELVVELREVTGRYVLVPGERQLVLSRSDSSDDTLPQDHAPVRVSLKYAREVLVEVEGGDDDGVFHDVLVSASLACGRGGLYLGSEPKEPAPPASLSASLGRLAGEPIVIAALVTTCAFLAACVATLLRRRARRRQRTSRREAGGNGDGDGVVLYECNSSAGALLDDDDEEDFFWRRRRGFK
eukprot:CAMPEP_0170746114 /NCGR_PEP_ID=MMETSP0437-20130122/8642_1 /TAXON_ID=0 /ORGANISM="Sexangularia sp." /LENGTH=437 /DNA_ID=CAMNT_0011084855 /DNA_START=590 /DNA_END=1903 /DNA_ORIENTATION=-